MFTKIFHHYSHRANQTFNWLPADTKEKYKENLITQHQKLLDNNWIDRHFTYKFNNHGFRCNEFTLDPSIMFLGCSHTCGIGLPIEHTWAYLVSQQLNLNMINLGIGGTGPDTAFRLANHYIHQLHPKIVIYLEPENSRFCFIDNKNEIINFHPMFNISEIPYGDFYSRWIMNQENLNLNGLKHKLAIEAICNRNNIKLITLDDNIFNQLDLARDLQHRGVKSNAEFSKFVLDAISLEEPRGIEPRFQG